MLNHPRTSARVSPNTGLTYLGFSQYRGSAGLRRPILPPWTLDTCDRFAFLRISSRRANTLSNTPSADPLSPLRSCRLVSDSEEVVAALSQLETTFLEHLRRTGPTVSLMRTSTHNDHLSRERPTAEVVCLPKVTGDTDLHLCRAGYQYFCQRPLSSCFTNQSKELWNLTGMPPRIR